MAILLYGKTPCCVCDMVIEEGSDTFAFPAFILNQNDPLFPYSDAVCHRSCAAKSPFTSQMVEESNRYLLKTGPGNRSCCVCEAQITEYSDYFVIGYLGRESLSGLHEFSYSQFHKAHIHLWSRAGEFLKSAQAELASGRWKGADLLFYINTITDSLMSSKI